MHKLSFPMTLTTSGDGMWSNVSKTVNITHIGVPYIPRRDVEYDYCEFVVYFDKSWNTRKDGLIYSDPRFMTELRATLSQAGFPVDADDIAYSEQGMQDRKYVSFDINKKFLAAYLAKWPATEEDPGDPDSKGNVIGPSMMSTCGYIMPYKESP